MVTPSQQLLGETADNERGISQQLEPTRGKKANPFDWVDASMRQVYASVDKVYPNAEYLSITHPKTKYLQAWADRLDKELRDSYPEHFTDHRGVDSVPRPRIRIMKHSSLNAFSSFSLVCYRLPIIFEKNDLHWPLTEQTGEFLMIKIAPNGSVGFYKKDQIDCIDRTDETITADQWTNILLWLTKSLRMENCRAKVTEDGLWFSKSCRFSTKESRQTANGIVIQATTQWVTIFTGLLDALAQQEALVVSALFHELAHFYRAHGALTKSRYNYFYKINEFDHRKAKPKPAGQKINTLGKKLNQLPKFRTQAIPQQIWHSEIFSYNEYAKNLIIDPICSKASGCDNSCKDLLNLLENQKFKISMKNFPQSHLDEKEVKYYFKWELLFQSCLDSIYLGNSNLKDHIQTEIAQQVFWLHQKEESSTAPTTVLDLAESMNQKLFEKQQAQDELLNQGLLERVGFYNTEEEADYLSMDWLNKLQLNPKATVDQWLEYAKNRAGQEQSSDYNFSSSKCLELYHAEPRWTENGIRQLIPVGSYSHSHHSTCFRIWALDRRLKLRYGM